MTSPKVLLFPLLSSPSQGTSRSLELSSPFLDTTQWERKLKCLSNDDDFTSNPQAYTKDLQGTKKGHFGERVPTYSLKCGLCLP